MKTLSLKVFLAAVMVGAVSALAFVPPVLPFLEGAAIKVWSSGERVSSTDLNGNFQHIHNLMVGGHGGRLVDADISPNAAFLKRIPKAWGWVQLSGGVLTLQSSMNVTSINKFAGGQVDITLAYTPTDAKFSVMVTCTDSSANRCTTAATNYATAAPQFRVNTFPANANALADSSFSFAVYDDN